MSGASRFLIALSLALLRTGLPRAAGSQATPGTVTQGATRTLLSSGRWSEAVGLLVMTRVTSGVTLRVA